MINQSIKFIISVAHCRLDFTVNSRKNTSAMLNVNTTKKESTGNESLVYLFINTNLS